MFRRNISVEMVEIGIIIADYPYDKPYPSCLILGFINDHPLHVVIAKNENGTCIVVISYIPDKSIWLSDFETKRN